MPPLKLNKFFYSSKLVRNLVFGRRQYMFMKNYYNKVDTLSMLTTKFNTFKMPSVLC